MNYKMGDKVLYNGEEWEVGFVNQRHFQGTLRLQKSGDSSSRQINYVHPNNVILIPTLDEKEFRKQYIGEF
jgi:hypothetical protein